ncbi:hypothetical protein HZA41_03525 [Candidatus Peregrinibacteria bacterium]|nr:hypothetical protein [Candidatus Peregrinibacteria bacterium]
MRDQRAFIPDGWEIREIEKPEEKMQIRYEMGQEKKEAPKTTKEIQEIKTRMNQLEKRKDAVKKLASELTAVLQREVAERTQGQPLQKGINESVIARYEANFEEIVQRAKAKKTATRAIPETIAQPRTVILDQKFSDGKISSSAIPRSGISQQVTLEKAITPTIETPEISETGAMAYMTELFEIVRRIFGAKTIPEGQKIASEKTQEAEQQAVEALITLEEIFASMKIAPSSEKTVSMNELFTTPIDVEVEIITKTRETLHSLRLAFDLDPSVINSLITNNS